MAEPTEPTPQAAYLDRAGGALMDLRITLKGCDQSDADDLIRHLEEQGLMATFEVGTARSRRGWAPFPEREEEEL